MEDGYESGISFGDHRRKAAADAAGRRDGTPAVPAAGAAQDGEGQLVAVQGYLTQHMRGDGALSVEVTADEFLPANKGSAREQASPAKRMDGAHENTAVYSPQTEGKSSLPDEEDGSDAASMFEAAS